MIRDYCLSDETKEEVTFTSGSLEECFSQDAHKNAVLTCYNKKALLLPYACYHIPKNRVQCRDPCRPDWKREQIGWLLWFPTGISWAGIHPKRFQCRLLEPQFHLQTDWLLIYWSWIGFPGTWVETPGIHWQSKVPYRSPNMLRCTLDSRPGSTCIWEFPSHFVHTLRYLFLLFHMLWLRMTSQMFELRHEVWRQKQHLHLPSVDPIVMLSLLSPSLHLMWSDWSFEDQRLVYSELIYWLKRGPDVDPIHRFLCIHFHAFPSCFSSFLCWVFEGKQRME